MITTRRALAILLLAICSVNIATAQRPSETQFPRDTEQTIDPALPGKEPSTQPSPVIVTATATSQRVRYASLGEVHQTRLQVFSVDGSQVFDSSFKLGNLIDWHLKDQQGLSLPDGSYLFLITISDFSERLTQKYGTAVLEQQQVYLQQTLHDEVPQAQSAALEANRQSEVISLVDRIGAAGLNSTTADTTDGSTKIDALPSDKKNPASQTTPGTENIAGTGSQNRIAKWIDNSGTLGDSSLYETAAARVGLGTTSPGAKFHVVGVQGSLSAGTFQLDTTTQFSGWTAAYPTFELVNANQTNNNVSLFQFADTPSGASHAGIGAVSTSHVNKFGDLFFYTKQADGYQIRMGIFGDNVGIGTVSPLAKLQVQTASENYGLIHSNGIVEVGTWVGSGSVGSQSGWIGTKTGHPLRFFAGGSGAAMTIMIDGKVGIGTYSPTSAKLTVVSGNLTGVESTSAERGVLGISTGSQSYSIGVHGQSAGNDGVLGESTSSNPNAGAGVHGYNQAGGYAGRFDGGVLITGHLEATGGMTVTGGCNGCSPPSDRNLKANFSAVNPRLILNRLSTLPIQSWNYKSEPDAVRHIGPMAQDFRSAFLFGADDRTLNTVDAQGVTMAAIQGLYQMMLEKERENKQLVHKVGQLQAQLNQVKRTIRRKRALKR
jgi:hypothetical protein